MKRLLYRSLRALGLHIERHRDAYDDLASLAGPNVQTVIDGGAHYGGSSEAFLRLFPRAKVIAFEPQPKCIAKINARIGDNPRFTVEPLALSDREGEATFHVPAADFTASLLTPGQSFGATETLTVRVTTLDSFPADVIKLDLQGNELAALKGATKILPGVKAVLCEVNFVPRYDGCALAHDVMSFLAGYGLQFHRFYEVHTSKTGRWEFADALFVRG